MPFRLNKSESAQRVDHVNAVELAGVRLSQAVGAYNEVLTAAKEALLEAQEAYNETLGEAREFVEDIASSRREDYDAKSDRWKEGDNGTAAEAFTDAWEGIDLEPVDFELPDEIEEPDLAHRDDLEALPEEA